MNYFRHPVYQFAYGISSNIQYSGAIGKVYTDGPLVNEGTNQEDLFERFRISTWMEAATKWTWICTWYPRSSEQWDSLGESKHVSWEVHVEAIFMQD